MVATGRWRETPGVFGGACVKQILYSCSYSYSYYYYLYMRGKVVGRASRNKSSFGDFVVKNGVFGTVFDDFDDVGSFLVYVGSFFHM